MKKLLWMLLAALPMQAIASDDDPIAYKCYYCTPDEMETVALAQGVGTHYVYDAYKLTISGYTVHNQDGALKAEPFEKENWLEAQFLGMIALYNPYNGAMDKYINNVTLLAPNTEHGRNITDRYMWGQHLTALNPHHAEARRTVLRYLTEFNELSFLDTTSSGGKLLKFEYMLDGNHPIGAAISFSTRSDSIASFFFDHDSRQWQYSHSSLPQNHSQTPLQESREDFAPEEGDTVYDYRPADDPWVKAFVERAKWANIPVHGQRPFYNHVRITCKRAGEDIQCYIQ
ncbi:hypothetical protein [Stenotrophomonas sp. PD6]|uniref:hypothetical protein n=1 Tax=Stenotrophomonas sp. PD6 TaxID=3368612 RepID=UPI003BA2F2D5